MSSHADVSDMCDTRECSCIDRRTTTLTRRVLEDSRQAPPAAPPAEPAAPPGGLLPLDSETRANATLTIRMIYCFGGFATEGSGDKRTSHWFLKCAYSIFFFVSMFACTIPLYF